MGALARILAILVLVVGLTTPPIVPAPEQASAESAVKVRSAAGADVSRLLIPSRSRDAVWKGAPTIGPALTTRFTAPTRIDGTSIRAAAIAQRLSAARLMFSDGSSLAVRLNSRGDRTVFFTPRTVRWVTLAIDEVHPAQKSVGLSGWTLHRGGSSRLLSRKSVAKQSAVTASSGSVSGTRWTASLRRPGQWMQLRWKKPVEVSAVRIYGGANSTASTVLTGSLRFSDGSRVLVGSLEPEGGAPTTIAFTPRVATSIRFVATSVRGNELAAVHSIRAYPVGEVPSSPKVSAKTYKQNWTAARSCAGVSANGSSLALKLLCPTNGTETGDTLHIVVGGPAGAKITAQAWRPHGTGGSVTTVATAAADCAGTARLTIATRRLLRGPAAVRLTASGVGTPLYVQFINASGVKQKQVPSRVTKGMDLKFDDDFTAPLSATRSGAGAVYASGKPNSYGVDDFGAAIFAQPDGTGSTSSTTPGGYLRIPARALPPGHIDPAGYGRTSTGGLLASAHMHGSGFSAQYGYFEARMLGPAGEGTWPAFWMLSTGSLVGGGSTAEVDAVELYGDAPGTAFQTSHSWVNRRDVLNKPITPAMLGSGGWALSWHTYGARVSPAGVDYYVDGVRAGHTPPVVHDDEPFFFLVNLALTGNWNTGLASTGHRADLFVDWVRVWV